MESCLYRGTVRHRRFSPVGHEFTYSLFLLYLDLDELDTVFRGRWLWSTRRPALARFHRRDHLGDPELPLAEAVRRRVEEETGHRPEGPVRLLTHPRYFGYGMNPVSFFYCFDAAGERVEWVIAEVNNTPWGERHCYVMAGESAPQRAAWSVETPKRMHVSPFLDMDLVHRWTMKRPGSELSVYIEDLRDSEPVLDATLVMRRQEISGRSLGAALLRFPAMTAQVVARIYFQALRLWLKRVPFHDHPKHRPVPEGR